MAMLAAGAGNAAGALAFGQPSLPGGSGHGGSGQLPSLADLHRLNMTNIMNMMHRKVFSFWTICHQYVSSLPLGHFRSTSYNCDVYIGEG